jgi:hypothetical protein
LSLLHSVAARLETGGIPFALIGAAALALRGVSRSTADVDLLTVDTRCLERVFWGDLATEDQVIRLLKGDFEDPLAGSVRIAAPAERTVDVVVGRYKWQAEVIERAERLSIGAIVLPVAQPADLILLKLFAGGPKDAWDITALLEVLADRRDMLVASVERDVDRLPAESRQLWIRIVRDLK